MDHAKQSAADALKATSKRVIGNAAEATGYSVGNKTTNKTTLVSNNSQQNNLETVTFEDGKLIPKERYISPKERQRLIDDLWLNNKIIM